MPNAAPSRIMLALALCMLGVLMISMLRNPQPRSAIEPVAITYRININTADRDTLCLLNDIGPNIAQNLIDHREAHGKFNDVSEIEQVHRIGPKTRASVERWVTVR